MKGPYFMKIINLKCPQCGAELEVHEEGLVKCKFCGSTFYAEADKAPITMNTTINNFNTATSSYNTAEAKNKAMKIVGAVITGCTILLFFVIYMMVQPVSGGKLKYSAERRETAITNKLDKYYTDNKKSSQEKKYTGSGLEDISFLREKSYITELELTKCGMITDYSVLNNMPNIESLTLKEASNLDNLNFLSSMTKIKNLSIEGSEIEDLSPLSNKLSLTALELYNNQKIQDYTAVTSLKSLKKLYINSEDSAVIPDISGLNFLTDVKINEK